MSETRSVEATGANIEEAISAGLEELQVSRESVIVEVLEEPSRGLLGLGSKMALVRLTTAARPRPLMEEDAPNAAPELDAELPDEDEVEDDEDDTQARPPKRTPQAWQPFPEPQTVPPEDYQQEILVGKAKLEELLALMTIEAEVQVQTSFSDGDNDDETQVLQIVGDDLSNLIGRRGDTLTALQYITRLIASRDLQRRAKFVVDAGEYKANRAEKLYQLANRMANQAVERRRVVNLEPMPPHERRIVHMALRHRDDVSTSSIDEGRYRKVTIIPRDA